MRAVLVGLLLLSGCGDPAWLLPEAEALATARTELATRGIQATDTAHVVDGVIVCDGATCDPPRSLTLDGWDATRSIGIEYVADDDPDFGAGTSYSGPAASERLQAAIDARLAGAAKVLIVHQWAHETAELCRDQFLSNLRARLDALGL